MRTKHNRTEEKGMKAGCMIWRGRGGDRRGESSGRGRGRRGQEGGESRVGEGRGQQTGGEQCEGGERRVVEEVQTDENKTE